MRKNIAKMAICLLLSLTCILSACDKGSSEEELFGTTAEKKTQVTTQATTEEPKAEVPHLVPEILEENTNLVIGRLSEPVVRQITDKISIDLQYQGWPTICAGDGNTVYAASSVRIGHIDPFGCIGFYKSEDGGQTWSTVKIIADTPIDDRDAGIVYLGGGKILVSWFTHNISNYMQGGQYYGNWNTKVTDEQRVAALKKFAELDYADQQAASYVMLSKDYGETWDEPVKVPVSAPHGPTLMQDGRTLLYFGDPHNPKGMGITDMKQHYYYAYTSRDYGKTWTRFAELKIPYTSTQTFDEPYMLQLQDGTFIAGIRGHVNEDKEENGNAALRVFISHSENGKVWDEFKELEGTVGTPPHFFQTKEGVLILAYSHRLEPCGARGRISYDNGYTWSDEFIISVVDGRKSGDLGYASTTQLPDGTLLTAYYQNCFSTDKYRSFLYTRWRLVDPNEAG